MTPNIALEMLALLDQKMGFVQEINIIRHFPVRQTHPELFLLFWEATFPDFPQYCLILLRGLNFNQRTPQASTMHYRARGPLVV